jgi:signal transduction histidine kinase
MLIEECRVLVCAPMGRDAQLIGNMLAQHNISAAPQPTLESLSAELLAGAAVAMITEEALYGDISPLIRAMDEQPPWSDLPLIVLTTSGEESAEKTWSLLRRLEPIGNVTLLERPLRAITLVSAVQVALRSRARQYEVRSLYEDLERRVEERTAELQRLNEEAEGFSYTIAHDLRSPLRAIVSTSRILLEDHRDELSIGAVAELERQATCATRLATLIDDLLRLSRLSREQMKPVAFDLSELVQEVAESLHCEEISIQPGMTAFGDPLLIRLAMLNLLENACKFSPEGGTISVHREGDTYVVADRGIGFSEAYAEKIFKPFERLVNETSFPGTGIGLANVKRIIERHGGRIWAESEPGQGARFYFQLGAAEAQPELSMAN